MRVLYTAAPTTSADLYTCPLLFLFKLIFSFFRSSRAELISSSRGTPDQRWSNLICVCVYDVRRSVDCHVPPCSASHVPPCSGCGHDQATGGPGASSLPQTGEAVQCLCSNERAVKRRSRGTGGDTSIKDRTATESDSVKAADKAFIE